MDSQNTNECFYGCVVGFVVPITSDFCSCGPSTKYIFPRRTLFKFLCSHRPASWAGSRAGSPGLLVCVSVADFSNNAMTSVMACDNDYDNDSWRQELQRQFKMDDEKTATAAKSVP